VLHPYGWAKPRGAADTKWHLEGENAKSALYGAIGSTMVATAVDQFMPNVTESGSQYTATGTRCRLRSVYTDTIAQCG